DLAKRVKEAAFKTIDLKAAYGQIMAGRGQAASAPSGNLTTWLRSVQPSAYLFIAARVISQTDFDAAVRFADTASQVMDGVGLFCFGPASESQPTTYKILRVPRHLGIDQVLYRACQDLVALRDQPPEPIPAAAMGPAAGAQAALDSLEPEEADDSVDGS
ncbi:MAG: hypothetical protein ABSB75_04650, partial [Candidatus Limnocylindrales bacterium]